MELSAGVVYGVVEYQGEGESPVFDLLFGVCPVEN
jgi:hypothetical protein